MAGKLSYQAGSGGLVSVCMFYLGIFRGRTCDAEARLPSITFNTEVNCKDLKAADKHDNKAENTAV